MRCAVHPGKDSMKKMHSTTNHWMLVIYDTIVFAIAALLLLTLYESTTPLKTTGIIYQCVMAYGSIMLLRLLFGIYQQIWRFGGIQCYIRLLAVDSLAFLVYFGMNMFLRFHPLPGFQQITFARQMSLVSLNLLGSLTIRMIYRYAYKCGNQDTRLGRFLSYLLRLFSGLEVVQSNEGQKIKVAIIGAGRVGVSLAEEMLNNQASVHTPRCFVDADEAKVGRQIHGITVYSDEEATFEKLRALEIQEIVFAIPSVSAERQAELYEYYKQTGCKLKVYDYPTMQTTTGKRHLRDFDTEDLLFRRQVQVEDENTAAYYKDKVILLTGGGGSIGSELGRQLAGMGVRQLVVLDIAETGVYDLQQDMRIAYGDRLDLQVEIASITNYAAMDRIFARYRPDIVINAAAHKHVPLMEKNVVEAVENNVFGCEILVSLCEKYAVERFMMVSTDKAVNPTNIMGATKRMCEMIVQAASVTGHTRYSCTRFGNVLGSAGSVIPLFKRQIAAGGPITLTDKRIIRYFMTIPEASQLVLQSGTMARNGEIFVLDMGKPVKILDLAENMIRLSGVQGIEIVEIGLRPGEKLYEELLVRTEELDKTENKMIFIERDTPLSTEELARRMQLLHEACATGSDEAVRQALHEVVPTFKRPEEVNDKVE